MCATLRLNSSTFEILNSTGKIFSFFTNMWNFVFHIFHKVCGIQFSTISTKNVEFSLPTFSTNYVEFTFRQFSQSMWNSVYHSFAKYLELNLSTFSTNYLEFRFPHFPQCIFPKVCGIQISTF